jgi:pimeloyl-ACP methyl ester carboxylesterase
MKKMVLVFMAIFVGAVVAEDLEMHRFGGGYGSVRYFATSPLEKGSPAEVALVVVHGWGGGAEKCEEAKSFLGAAVKLLREGERMPYVIEPLFPRRAVLKKHNVSAEGLSLWNESWSRDLTQRGRAVDDWRGGGDASNGSFSSYDVIDLIFSRLGDKSSYPNLRRVVLAGFSAGGQFVSRYAAVGKGEVRAGVEMAYVAMSPSSWLRLDPSAPWHYGLDGRTRYSKGVSNDQVSTNLSARTVVYACGSADVSVHGALDKTPPAMAQGINRYDRFLHQMSHIEAFPAWRAKAIFHVFGGMAHDWRGAYSRREIVEFVLHGRTDLFSVPDAQRPKAD